MLKDGTAYKELSAVFIDDLRKNAVIRYHKEVLYNEEWNCPRKEPFSWQTILKTDCDWHIETKYEIGSNNREAKTIAIEHVNESSLQFDYFITYQCLTIAANASLALAISSSV